MKPMQISDEAHAVLSTTSTADDRTMTSLLDDAVFGVYDCTPTVVRRRFAVKAAEDGQRVPDHIAQALTDYVEGGANRV